MNGKRAREFRAMAGYHPSVQREYKPINQRRRWLGWLNNVPVNTATFVCKNRPYRRYKTRKRIMRGLWW